MDTNRIRQLAGLETLPKQVLTEKKKWSGDVEAKVEIPEGLFTKKASTIVSKLIKLHDGDIGKASKALNFYINRAGKDVANKEELDAAKDLMKEKIKNESLNMVRRMSGLAPIMEKKGDDDMDADDAPPADDAPADDEEAKEDEVPAIITKIAAKAEGKSGDDMVALLQKVYDAGFKDGKKAAEEDEGEGKEEEVKEGSSEKKSDLLSEISDQKVDAVLKARSTNNWTAQDKASIPGQTKASAAKTADEADEAQAKLGKTQNLAGKRAARIGGIKDDAEAKAASQGMKKTEGFNLLQLAVSLEEGANTRQQDRKKREVAQFAKETTNKGATYDSLSSASKKKVDMAIAAAQKIAKASGGTALSVLNWYQGGDQPESSKLSKWMYADGPAFGTRNNPRESKSDAAVMKQAGVTAAEMKALSLNYQDELVVAKAKLKSM